MSLYITGLVVGMGLGIMLFAGGILIYLEHFKRGN